MRPWIWSTDHWRGTRTAADGQPTVDEPVRSCSQSAQVGDPRPVCLYRLSPEGRRLTLGVLGPGALFGEMELVGQRMGDGFAEAVEPSVLCLMSEHDVRSMLLADTVLKPVPQRLAAVLCQLVEAAPQSGVLSYRGPEIRLTHEQIADLVGTTRATTTKLLGDLRESGLVRLRRGGVVVLDRDRLQAVADHG